MCVHGARTADGSSHWHKAKVLPVFSDRERIQGVLWWARSGVRPLQRDAKQLWHEGNLETHPWSEAGPAAESENGKNKRQQKDAWDQSHPAMTCWYFSSLAKYADEQ